jgi:hypothetical protein
LEQSDEFDKKLNNEGITHNYIVGEEMFHVWPIFKIMESKKPFDLIVHLVH